MTAVPATTLFVDAQNMNNRSKTSDFASSKNKRFLSRKIHKLKKVLKLSSNFFRKHNSVAASDVSFEEWQNHQNSIEEQMQNYENELLEKKMLAKQCSGSDINYGSSLEHDQNVANENWENWDSCYMCAPQHVQPPHIEKQTQQYHQQAANSVCYVFMPGQIEPVAVKLRNARIAGGVMWIVYRPDLDICCRDHPYEMTSNQIAQAQRPVLV